MNVNIELFDIFSVYTHVESFGFNTDFLEANVVNILLLLFGLLYVLRQFLGALLDARQKKVLLAIQESEERLQKANMRLLESEKQLKHAEMVIQQIEQEAIVTAAKVRQSILDQGKLDIERLTEAGKASIIIAERKVRDQIQQQITYLAIRQVAIDLKQQMTYTVHSKIIDENIVQLGEKL